MAIFNNFSTQSVYDSINMALYNIVWTSLPIFIYGLFEQNLPAATLMNHPKLYKNNAKNRLLAKDKCLLWNAEALWHCLASFFGFYFYWMGNSNLGNPKNSLELWCFGVAVYQTIVVTVSLKLLLYSKHWNGFMIGSIICSLSVFCGFT